MAAANPTLLQTGEPAIVALNQLVKGLNCSGILYFQPSDIYASDTAETGILAM